MSSRFTSLALVLLLIIALVSTGCGSQQSAAPQQDSQKVYELKLHHHVPPGGNFGQFFDAWAKEISAKSNGRIKITVYPGSSLGPAAQTYNMVTTGVCDIALGAVAMMPGQFPGTEIMHLPMLGVRSATHASKTLWEMYKTTDYLKKEYQNVQVLFLFAEGGTPIGTKSKKIVTAADLQGLKIRTPGGPVMDFLKTAGAAPIGLPPGNIYESMGKGVIDGYLIGWEGIDAFKLTEDTKYVLDANLYTSAFWVAMNKEKYNSLPPDLRKILDEASGEAAIVKMAQIIDGVEKKVDTIMVERGITKTPLAADEQKKWEELALEVQDKWIVDVTAKGFPAKEAVVKAKELMKKNSQ